MNILYWVFSRLFLLSALLLLVSGSCQFPVADMPSERNPNTFADWQYQQVSAFYDSDEYRANPLGAVVWEE